MLKLTKTINKFFLLFKTMIKSIIKEIKMSDNELTIIRKYAVIPVDDTEGFDLKVFDEMDKIIGEYLIRYQEIIDDIIYKNIPTSILQVMKLRIENELMERRLKENDNKNHGGIKNE